METAIKAKETHSDAATDGIRVRVQSRYLAERSDPRVGKYLFGYHVVISNEGNEPAQLLTRHWIIMDGTGKVEEVRGPGVVGEQPYLTPGESFTYDSFCPLPTEFGTMRGTYQMVRDDGRRFDAVIAPFLLARPHAVN